MEEDDDVSYYEQKLKKGCRLITLFLPPVGLLPDAQDYVLHDENSVS
jgi:hypothetical protein